MNLFRSLVIAMLVGAIAAPVGAAFVAPDVELTIGFEGDFPTAAVEATGADVLAVHADAGFATVSTSDPASAIRAVMDAGVFRFSEVEGSTGSAAVGSDGTSGDSATWDRATWDRATWDRATWDRATWDAASWDRATWDRATWDAASWDRATWDSTTTEDPGYSEQWSLGAMGADVAWTTTTAYRARTICAVDSGIDAGHTDVGTNVKRAADGSFGRDFVDGDNLPFDSGGHGTHVAGIAAAVAGNGAGVTGVSQAYVIGARVLNSDGSGVESDLALGIRYCADAGAHIIVMALHMDGPSYAVYEAVQYARGRGLLVIAATGNQAQTCDDCVAYPAAYPGVLGIGASAPDGRVAPFSNQGREVDLLAPGVDIAGPFPGDMYAVMSGTSQAAGNAAGAAALVWAAHPTLTANQVASRLTSTAKDAGPTGWDPVFGFGHIRVDRAVGA